MNRFKSYISGILLGYLILGTGSTVAQGNCFGPRNVERDYHDFATLLEPDNAQQALATAAQVKLRLRHAISAQYLHENGIRPSQDGAKDLELAIDGLRELADRWLNDDPVRIFDRRRLTQTKKSFASTLTSSGCFVEIHDALARDFTAAPEELKPEFNNPSDPNSLSAKTMAAFAGIPFWLWALVVTLIGGVLATWLFLRHRKRQLETRGHPRQIFVGNLVLRVGETNHTVRAVDIGRGGAKIHRKDALSGISKAFLIYSEQAIPVLVGWENKYFMGVSFHAPISRQMLNAITRGRARNETGAY